MRERNCFSVCMSVCVCASCVCMSVFVGMSRYESVCSMYVCVYDCQL